MSSIRGSVMLEQPRSERTTQDPSSVCSPTRCGRTASATVTSASPHPEINDFALAEEVTPRYGTTDTLEQFLVQWKDAGPHRHVHPDGAGRITGK